MKYWLFLIMIFIVTNFNKFSYADKPVDLSFQVSSSSQQDPFYFLGPVPNLVKLLDKIDLSFFRNKLVVTQYRYRLQLPSLGQTAIDGRLLIWSAWIKDDLTEIRIPRLDQEGGYKLIIEYKPQTSNETKRFEKVFYVYYVNPVVSTEVGKPTNRPQTDRKTGVTAPAPNRTANNTIAKTSGEKSVNAPAKTITNLKDKTPSKISSESTGPGASKTSAKSLPANDNVAVENRRINDKRFDLKGVKIKVNINPKIVPLSESFTAESSEKMIEVEKSTTPKFDSLFTGAIEKKDTVLFVESIQNGGGAFLKGKNGGNIFHWMNGTFGSENIITMLKNKGFSINEIDNNGNSPLHLAILSGDVRYIRSLINQGADLNIKNNLELSPLHLAVLLKNEEVVDDLLKKGAEVDLKGNTGYAPLHIASELNYIEIANILLLNGAKIGIKTKQGLSPKAIAKIQKNNEILSLISKKGSDTPGQQKSITIRDLNKINSANQNLTVSFDLPYDTELAKKRQFNKIVQILSIPVFALSTAYTIFLKTQANHNYSLSKIAETEELAKYYYDKTVRFDTFAYVSGGVSLVSAYGVIHSAIRKGSLTRKMSKTFN